MIRETTSALRNYEEAGIKMVRLGETKKPIDTEWQLRNRSLEDHVGWVSRGGNLGWQMGEVSGWISCADLDWPEARAMGPLFLPPTLLGAKGTEDPSQYFYRSVGLGFDKFMGLDGTEIISLKASSNGAGHQVVVEPSIHQKKGPYHFVGGFDPDRIATVDADELRHRVGMLAVASLLARILPESGRHNLALALAGYMLRNGEAKADVRLMLVAAWDYNLAPDEGIHDLEAIVRDTALKLERDEPVTGGRTLEELVGGLPRKIAKFLGWKNVINSESRQDPGALTDLGNGERLAERYGGELRYCHPMGRWFVWDGKRWRPDDTGQVIRYAKATVRSIYEEAAASDDDARAKEIAKWAGRSQAKDRIQAMISLAQSEPGIPVKIEELDSDPWLLNVENGTIDLRTGALKPHDPGDLITKLAPVAYDPKAVAPTWDAFLQRVLPVEELRGFLQRLSGYALTGDVSEQKLPFLYGLGANGKSTYINTFMEALGDYAQQAPPELLTVKGHSHPTELADLMGARLVASVEVEDGKRLAESLVKQLTGGERIKARYMRQDFFQFDPTHKVFLVANHRLEVRGTDHAIWRRIKMIPFEVTIPEDERDPRLPEKLKAELPGILAWAVKGCLEWQQMGLGEPVEVSAATDEYREEQDVLALFIEDVCEVHPAVTESAQTLYKEYSEWCQEQGEFPETQRKFGARLTEKGYTRQRLTSGERKGAYEYVGLRVFRVGNPPLPTRNNGGSGERTGVKNTIGERLGEKVHREKDLQNSEKTGVKNTIGERLNPENGMSARKIAREAGYAENRFTIVHPPPKGSPIVCIPPDRAHIASADLDPGEVGHVYKIKVRDALERCASAAPAWIVNETGLSPELVEMALEEFAQEGSVVERGGQYSLLGGEG